MKYTLELVNDKPRLWKDDDPVRPELGVAYKTYPGRSVYGLKSPDGDYDAFCCVAQTWGIPQDVVTLSNLTSKDGKFFIPYTVWSRKKGAGKEIIRKLLQLVKENDLGVERVVTMSPKTEMARRFHLKNGAREVGSGVVTVNFEYPLT